MGSWFIRVTVAGWVCLALTTAEAQAPEDGPAANASATHASTDAEAPTASPATPPTTSPAPSREERERALLREQLELEPIADRYPRLLGLQIVDAALMVTGLVFVLVADKNPDDGDNSFASGPFFGSGCGVFDDCVWSPGMYWGAVMISVGVVAGLVNAILSLKPARARARLREIDRELRGLRLEVSATGFGLRF